MNFRISLGITCARSVPMPTGGGAGATSFPYSDGSFHISVPDIQSTECDRILGSLAESGVRLRAYTFAGKGVRPDRWTLPEGTAVGATLLSDDVLKVDPQNPFRPRFPAPCLGVVPAPLPLRVTRPPRLPVASTLDNGQIVSDAICAVLRAEVDCVLGDVLCGQDTVPGWHRLFPDPQADVICASSLRRVSCAACGTIVHAAPGLMLGHRQAGGAAWVNRAGIDHGAAVHPMIVSVPLAERLLKLGLEGFGVDPVVDVESPAGQRMLALISALEPLRATRELPRAPAQ